MRKIVSICIYGLLIVGLLSSIVWVYKAFNRPVKTDVSMVENVRKVNTEEIISMFKSNEQEANATFIEKVIEVEGVVKDISLLNDRHTILLKSENFTQSFVMCDMSPLGNDKINKLTIGDTVVLKGVCKGFLLDVIMLNCMPINENTKN